MSKINGDSRRFLYRGMITLALLSITTDVMAIDTARLRTMLRHDCGACHGLTLRGGLGPPLTRAALAGKSISQLTETILDGREGTPMPGWQGLLTIEEAKWLATSIKEGIDTDDP